MTLTCTIGKGQRRYYFLDGKRISQERALQLDPKIKCYLKISSAASGEARCRKNNPTPVNGVCPTGYNLENRRGVNCCYKSKTTKATKTTSTTNLPLLWPENKYSLFVGSIDLDSEGRGTGVPLAKRWVGDYKNKTEARKHVKPLYKRVYFIINSDFRTEMAASIKGRLGFTREQLDAYIRFAYPMFYANGLEVLSSKPPPMKAKAVRAQKKRVKKAAKKAAKAKKA